MIHSNHDDASWEIKESLWHCIIITIYISYDHQWMRNDMSELALASGARGWTNGTHKGRVDCSLHSLDNCAFSTFMPSVVINGWTLLPPDGIKCRLRWRVRCGSHFEHHCFISVHRLHKTTICHISNTSPVKREFEKRFSQPWNIKRIKILFSK